MTRDEITQMVAAQNLPAPPASGSPPLKLAWLQIQLLQEIAAQLSDLNGRKAILLETEEHDQIPK